MSFTQHPQPQPLFSSVTFSEGWFIWPVRVFPHHTDYAGIVWHGTYVTWMEELRVESFRLLGLDYTDLVAEGCDLPVVELKVRYHQSVKMGMTILIKGQILPIKGVRMLWEYQIVSEDSQQLYVSAQVTLVPLSRETGKIMRRLPSRLQDVLGELPTLT
ncbi:acyl-CoA thioesterase [Capilliphycus salinus ALCB114379]|uniref:acyl-CoA thioesterase n=1 Tax=Capilliphycus salinus TaxID=2768948 RepID=UPI0039A42353